MTIRIQIEETCEHCKGCGYQGDSEPWECDACETTGYLTKYLSLKQFNQLLKENEK